MVKNLIEQQLFVLLVLLTPEGSGFTARFSESAVAGVHYDLWVFLKILIARLYTVGLKSDVLFNTLS